MALNNPYAAYQTTQTVTSGQTKLIVMLHDGAIRFLAQAAAAIGRQDYDQKAICIGKVFAILEHLWGTLDHARGGEIAENLEKIYSYEHSVLTTANYKNDLRAIQQIMKHLREIRQAWAEVDIKLGEERLHDPAATNTDELRVAA